MRSVLAGTFAQIKFAHTSWREIEPRTMTIDLHWPWSVIRYRYLSFDSLYWLSSQLDDTIATFPLSTAWSLDPLQREARDTQAQGKGRRDDAAAFPAAHSRRNYILRTGSTHHQQLYWWWSACKKLQRPRMEGYNSRGYSSKKTTGNDDDDGNDIAATATADTVFEGRGGRRWPLVAADASP